MSILAHWLTFLAQPFGLDDEARIILGASVAAVGIAGLVGVFLRHKWRAGTSARQATINAPTQTNKSPSKVMTGATPALEQATTRDTEPPVRSAPITRPTPTLITEVIARPARTSMPSQPIVITRGEVPSTPLGSGAVAIADRPRHEQLDVRDLISVDGAMEGLELLDPRTPRSVSPDDRALLASDMGAQEQYQRGLALLAGIHGESSRAPEEAVVCFHRAQAVWTREAAPERWATVQNDIGRAFQLMPDTNRTMCVRLAIEHHESALEIFDSVHHARSWAWTHSALGAAYHIRPVGSPLTNARAAVAHHEQALDVFTQQNAPLAWAWNQNNLGAAYEMMRGGAEGEWVANLRNAVTCYEAALEVYTRDTHPLPHQVVTHNLERVIEELRGLD